MIPMLEYLIGNGNHEIKAETIAAYCAHIEKEWLALNFPFKPTANEVVKYLNLRKKTDPDDRAFIVSDYDYSNCELYIFLSHCSTITALDSYGRCQTIEGLRRAFARGTQALQTGVLISHIKRLPPWTKYVEEFGSWNDTIDWLLSRPFGTSFTEVKFPPDEERLEIGARWKEVLRQAFAQD